MRISKTKAGIPLALLIAVCVPGAIAAQAADEAGVHETVDAFKAALRGGDADAAMATLHPDARIFEGGHAETRSQYESGHLRADMAFAGAVTNTTNWSDVSIDGDIAVYLREFSSTGTFREREIDSSSTETIVLRRTDGGWKIWHVHWSNR